MIKTRNIKIWKGVDGIIRVLLLRAGKITPQELEQIRPVFEKNDQNSRDLFIVAVRNVQLGIPEWIKAFSRDDIPDCIGALAVLLPGQTSLLLAKAFLAANNFSFPIGLFLKEKECVNWLKTKAT